MKKIRTALLLTYLFVSACTDKSLDLDSDDTNQEPGSLPPAGQPVGNFTFKGEPNTGVSRCYLDSSSFTGTGKAASISVSQSGYIKHVILGNLPSSGSVSVSDRYDRTGCYSCPVILLSYGSLPYTTDKYYQSYSGSITKTTTGYTFTAQMIKTQNIGDPNPVKYSLTGSLNCQ